MTRRRPGHFIHGAFVDESSKECFGIYAATDGVGDLHQRGAGIECTLEDQAVVPFEDKAKISDVGPIDAEATLEERIVHDTPTTGPVPPDGTGGSRAAGSRRRGILALFT
jgi:hypothetical protein